MLNYRWINYVWLLSGDVLVDFHKPFPYSKVNTPSETMVDVGDLHIFGTIQWECFNIRGMQL